jgi:hypothetical protein
MLSFDVSWLSILVAAVAAFVVGMFWYSDLLFGKNWREHMGWTAAEMKKMQSDSGKMAFSMVGGFVANFVTAFFLVNFLAWLGTGSVGEALQFTFFLWLGFFAMQMLGSVFWEGRKFDFYLINSLYVLSMLLAMAAVIAAW